MWYDMLRIKKTTSKTITSTLPRLFSSNLVTSVCDPLSRQCNIKMWRISTTYNVHYSMSWHFNANRAILTSTVNSRSDWKAYKSEVIFHSIMEMNQIHLLSVIIKYPHIKTMKENHFKILYNTIKGITYIIPQCDAALLKYIQLIN